MLLRKEIVMLQMFRQRLYEVNDFILYVNEVRTDGVRLSFNEIAKDLQDWVDYTAREYEQLGFEVANIYPMLFGAERYLEETTGYQA